MVGGLKEGDINVLIGIHEFNGKLDDGGEVGAIVKHGIVPQGGPVLCAGGGVDGGFLGQVGVARAEDGALAALPRRQLHECGGRHERARK